jgi:hypothetical protein
MPSAADMGTPSSGPVRRAVKEAVRGTRDDAARPTAIQRSRARRALRREVRTRQAGLSRTWMFTGRRDRLLGGLAGVAVVAAAAGIVWLGGGQRSVGATGYSPSGTPAASPTPAVSVSPQPSVTPTLTTTPKPKPKQRSRAKEKQRSGVNAARETSGGSTGTGTGDTSGGNSGSGGTSTQSPKPDPEPSPTQTKPGPSK